MGIVKTNKKIDFLISKYTEDHILTYPEDSNVIIFSTSDEFFDDEGVDFKSFVINSWFDKDILRDNLKIFLFLVILRHFDLDNLFGCKIGKLLKDSIYFK